MPLLLTGSIAVDGVKSLWSYHKEKVYLIYNVVYNIIGRKKSSH